MKLEEKALFVEIVLFLKNNVENLDDLRYSNMLKFLKMRY